MKADPGAQQRLLELQEHDRRLGQLARLEADLPERAARDALVAERGTVRGDLAATSGVLEDARAELRRTEDDVALVEARVARDTERMMASTSAKDASALDHEIDSLRKRQHDLEEIELAVMERVEEHETAVAAIEGRLVDLDAEVAAAEALVAAALARIAEERSQLGAARAALAGELPADLVELYERQRARYGVGASLLRRGVSEASGVALLADELARVRAAAPDDVLICSSSEAILVRTPESGL
ncbi:MAG: hypothetical protein BGO95_11745 [Micrococcales bacterium 73-13]|nr:MAG: hypothetical protein BGO95_11745 [Micrococcales bacterium 73-13]